MAESYTMRDLVDHLKAVIERRFASKVAAVYWGDIGVYLPSSFLGARNAQKAIVALVPAYNHLVEGSRTAASEQRRLGVTILVMVNITPFFEAAPKEAYGERMLVELVSELADFFTQEEQITLGNRVLVTEVGDIDWSWLARKDQAIRGAGITFECRVRVDRQA